MIKINTYIERANKIHNNYYRYNNLLINKIKEVGIITCPEHGDFKQRFDAHIGGQGCPKCNGGVSKNYEEFLFEANKVHNNKYLYNKITYKGSRKKINIICPVHGNFEQHVTNHLKGHGCNKCSIEINSKKRILTTNDFIKKANIIHDFKYNYEDVLYEGTKEDVNIICPTHGIFKQKPNDHLMGKGCVYCSLNDSDGEKELYEYISTLVDSNVERNNRSLIKPKEVDIVIEEKKVCFEYNGLYWHSDFFKKKNYHQNKKIQLNKLGYNLITIHEDEYKNNKKIINRKIESILNINNKVKIYARKCIIKNIDNESFKEFINNNHIQGYITASIKLGLYYKNELIGVMSFRKNRDEWELSRFATSHTIIGGFNKILKFFIRNNEAKKIITYADLRFSNINENLYTRNGFKFDKITEPNYFYFKNNEKLSRNMCQKHKLNKLLKNFNPELSEYENMTNNGYKRIFDCGNIKYSYL